MTQPELLGPPPKPAKLVKVSLFLKKRPDISDDYFRAYWYHNHRVLFVDTKAFRKYVRKYNQVSAPRGRRDPERAKPGDVIV